MNKKRTLGDAVREASKAEEECVTQRLQGSDWHIIRSIGVEHRGDEILLPTTGGPPDVIQGIREMVLTIVGEFQTDEIDVVEVNGVRFKREA
jgi:hypothetical protein